MELKTPASLAHSMHAASHVLSRAFPTPEFLTMPAAGVDISDSSVKWLVLKKGTYGLDVETFGEMPLQSGIVVNGVIRDASALGIALHEMKKRMRGVHFAHAALPEEAAYVFEMHVPEDASRPQIHELIEFEFEGRVPITPEQAVFDFDRIQIHGEGEGQEIGVAVFPRELAENYRTAFETAGLGLLSLELEARSIARAVTPQNDEAVTLLVDFGRARTGFAVLKRGVPIFTSTVEVGGDAITRALTEKLSFTLEQAIEYRNEQGLAPEGGTKAPGLDAVVGASSALADEVARHYHYWDTRRNERGERMTPVQSVIIVGGSANLRGLADYIAARVQAPAAIGNVWSRVYDFDSRIPPIGKRVSLQYGTAIGLALRSRII